MHLNFIINSFNGNSSTEKMNFAAFCCHVIAWHTIMVLAMIHLRYQLGSVGSFY